MSGLPLVLVLLQLPISGRNCGPTCLSAYIQETINKRVSVQSIYQEIGKSYDTVVSFADLERAASRYNIDAQGCLLLGEKEIEDYAILAVDEEGLWMHFILVRRKNGKLEYFESRISKFLTLDVAELNKVWKGYALLLSKAKFGY